MKILILGGSRFFGRKLAQQLSEIGHDVSTLNRGISARLSPDKTETRIRCFTGDRNNPEFLKSVADAANWDLIYDVSCYDAHQARAACVAFGARVQRYIFISSQAVYNRLGGLNLEEQDFDPRLYSFGQDADCRKFYGEAKRQAETIFHKSTMNQVVSMRFPIVVGLDDYTERLRNHVIAIRNGLPVYYPNLDAKISLVSSDQAAFALSQMASKETSGALNISSPDAVSIRTLIHIIGRRLKRSPLVAASAGQYDSWFDWRHDVSMKTDKAASLGIKLEAMEQWLPKLVGEIDSDLAQHASGLPASAVIPAPRYPLDAIQGRITTEINEPIKAFVFENLFSDSFYAELVKSFQSKLDLGLSEEPDGLKFARSDARAGTGPNEVRYGAYVHRIRERDSSPFGIFYSRMFFNWMQKQFNFSFSPHVLGSLHHHVVGSPDGWIHTDYHFCNFHWRPNAIGINPWSPGTEYQRGYSPQPEVLKCVRAVAIIYYLGNKPWKVGEGGETCFFRAQDKDTLYMKIPPKNNTAVVFEVAPNSFHTFVQNVKHERNSVAFWFHVEVSDSLRRFNVLPLLNS